jgi:hypothetical protein
MSLRVAKPYWRRDERDICEEETRYTPYDAPEHLVDRGRSNNHGKHVTVKVHDRRDMVTCSTWP